MTLLALGRSAVFGVADTRTRPVAYVAFPWVPVAGACVPLEERL